MQFRRTFAPTRLVAIAAPAKIATMAATAALAGALLLPGCRDSNRVEHYTPPATLAEDALRATLTAWQQSDSTPIVLDDETRVEVADAYRRPGQKLKSFKILGEVEGNGGRWFEVQLQLDQPAQVEQVRYVVIGIRPLWVFQQADYEMLAHWDHPVPDAPAPAADRSASAPASDDGARSQQGIP